MTWLRKKIITGIERGHALIGFITGSHLAVIFVVAGFLVVGVKALDAQEVYSPCWSREECLDSNVGGAQVPQPGRGVCDNQHCFEVGAGCSGGMGKCYANPPPVNLAVHIGRSSRVIDVGDYIAKVYNYGVSIAGLLAGVMFVVGGFQYLTAGDSERVKQAKQRIKDALIGLLLVFGAYGILNTINPDVLRLQMPKIPLVKKRLFVACAHFEFRVKCGDPFALVRVPGVPADAAPERAFRLATADEMRTGSVDATQCRGMSCSMAGLSDGTHRCRIRPGDATAPPTAPSQCGQAPAAPYECHPCFEWLHDCNRIGRSSVCCSGFCGSDSGAMLTDVFSAGGVSVSDVMGNGTCTNGENGVTCQRGGQCKSGLCQTRMKNRCSSGLGGAPCDDDNECKSGFVCVEMTGIHFCVKPSIGGYCDGTEDCPSGSECHNARCMPPGVTSYTECSNDAACAGYGGNLKCNNRHGRNVCSERTLGSPCRADSGWSDADRGCVNSDTGFNGSCVGVVTDCTAISAAPGACTDGEIGSVCSSHAHCKGQNRCYKGDIGPWADDMAASVSTTCSDSFGFCVSGLAGSGCKPGDAQGCRSGFTCHERSHTCIPDPANACSGS